MVEIAFPAAQLLHTPDDALQPAQPVPYDPLAQHAPPRHAPDAHCVLFVHGPVSCRHTPPTFVVPAGHSQ